MTKHQLKLLEKVFEAEILGKLPFQSKSKGYKKLEHLGLVEFDSTALPGRFPVTVSGWFLTHVGRYVYCDSCGWDPQALVVLQEVK